MGGFLDTAGSLFGEGSPNNTQWQATQAQLIDPVSAAQAQNAYGQTQNALQQQQSLARVLAQQGGAQNQSQVFGQEQQLAQALQNQANGNGPNPAQQALANATGANVANQAALMAGQRGASGNAGLIARQAAQQGAGIQQNAVGQSAVLQAQQQLAAQQQLQAQQAQMAQLAGQQVNQQANAVTGYNEAAQNQQAQLLNAIGQQNNARVASQANANSGNAALAQQNAQTQQATVGGLINQGAGAAMKLFSDGGRVENPKLAQVPMKDRYAFGGSISEGGPFGQIAQIYYPHMFNGGTVNVQSSPQDPSPIQRIAPGMGKDVFAKQGGGKPPSSPAAPASSGGGEAEMPAEMSASEGGKVPGKAPVKGDSYSNDKVHALLSAGEIVLPRSISQAADAPEKAREFVAALIAKEGGSRGGDDSDFKEALKKAISNRRSKK